MSKQNRTDLFEKYMDASVALFMEHYSAALTESVKINLHHEEVSIPPDLDRKCRSLIKEECTRYRRKTFCRTVSKGICKGISYAAVVLVVLLSLSSILFVTVEAVRNPIINFFIEQSDGFWSFTGAFEESNPTPTASSTKDVFDESNPLKHLLPNDYYLFDFEMSDTRIVASYLNQHQSEVYFCSIQSTGTLTINTEDLCLAEELLILDCEAILVKADELFLTWMDPLHGAIYSLTSNTLSEQELVDIARGITDQYRE